MRKMKKFHEAVVSWYLNWLLMISSLTMIYVLDEGWQIFFNFDWISWALMIGIGILAVTSQTARFKALKRYKAAQLQLLNPVITLLQFGFDVSQGTPFTISQYSCIGFLFCIYIVQGIKVAYTEKKKSSARKKRSASRALSKMQDENGEHLKGNVDYYGQPIKNQNLKGSYLEVLTQKNTMSNSLLAKTPEEQQVLLQERKTAAFPGN